MFLFIRRRKIKINIFVIECVFYLVEFIFRRFNLWFIYVFLSIFIRGYLWFWLYFRGVSGFIVVKGLESDRE